MTRRRSHFLRALTLDTLRACLAVVVFLVLFEIGLRATGMKYDGSLYTRDAVRFFGFRPDASAWVVYEGCNFVTINHAGLRDVDHEEGSKPDAIRIAFVGDSNAAAIAIPLGDTFIKVCERKLAESRVFGDKKVETLNFGVPAYNLAHEWLTLKTRVWQYSPNIVVLPLSMNGTVLNTTRALNYNNVATPYYVLEKGKLEQDEATRAFRVPGERVIRALDRLHQLENGYITFVMVQTAKSNVMGLIQSTWQSVFAPANPAASKPQGYIELWSLAPPVNEKVRNAWAVTEAFLEMMNQECLKHGAEFWIVAIDGPQQVDWRPEVRESLMKRAGVPDLYYPNRRFLDFAAKRNIHAVSLAEGLLRYAVEHRTFLHGLFNTGPEDRHLNAEGNRVAGELLANELKRSGYAVQ